MPIEMIDQTETDHPYLHRDFHLLLNRALAYIGDTYGTDGVRDYIRSYAKRYFSPMTAGELEQYFRDLYCREETSDSLETELTDSSLRVRISACPAVSYIKKSGDHPCRYYIHTVSTLYETVAEISGFRFLLHSYQPETGAAEMSFLTDTQNGKGATV